MKKLVEEWYSSEMSQINSKEIKVSEETKALLEELDQQLDNAPDSWEHLVPKEPTPSYLDWARQAHLILKTLAEQTTFADHYPLFVNLLIADEELKGKLDPEFVKSTSFADIVRFVSPLPTVQTQYYKGKLVFVNPNFPALSSRIPSVDIHPNDEVAEVTLPDIVLADFKTPKESKKEKKVKVEEPVEPPKKEKKSASKKPKEIPTEEPVEEAPKEEPVVEEAPKETKKDKKPREDKAPINSAPPQRKTSEELPAKKKAALTLSDKDLQVLEKVTSKGMKIELPEAQEEAQEEEEKQAPPVEVYPCLKQLAAVLNVDATAFEWRSDKTNVRLDNVKNDKPTLKALRKYFEVKLSKVEKEGSVFRIGPDNVLRLEAEHLCFDE